MFSSPSREQPTYLPPPEQKRKPKKDASLTTSSCERHISECSVLCSKLVLFWELNQVLGFAAACESKNRRHQTLYTIVNLCGLHAEELKTHPLSSSWTKCEILLFVFWLRTRPMRTKVKGWNFFWQNLPRLVKGLSKNYVIADGKALQMITALHCGRGWEMFWPKDDNITEGSPANDNGLYHWILRKYSKNIISENVTKYSIFLLCM